MQWCFTFVYLLVGKRYFCWKFKRYIYQLHHLTALSDLSIFIWCLFCLLGKTAPCVKTRKGEQLKFSHLSRPWCQLLFQLAALTRNLFPWKNNWPSREWFKNPFNVLTASPLSACGMKPPRINYCCHLISCRLTFPMQTLHGPCVKAAHFIN